MGRLRKQYLRLATGIFAALLFSGLNAGAAEAAKSPIVIGTIQPYTGEESSYGEWLNDAWKLATAVYGDTIHGHPLKLVKADGKCEPSVAVSAARQVIAQHPVMLLAPVCSGSTLAILPLIKSHELPTLSDNIAPPITKEGDGWVWRVQVTDAVVTPALMKYILSDGYKRVGLIYDTSAPSQAQAHDAIAALRTGGVRPAAVATFALSSTDYSGPLLKLKRANIDAIYIGTYETQGARLVTQARQLGFALPMYGGFSLFDPTFIAAAGNLGNGLIGATSYTPNWSDAAKKFDEQWFNKFHYHSNADIAALYEMAVAAITALEQNPGAKGKELNTIIAHTNIPGLPMGALSFASDGENANPLVLLVTWENQHIKVLRVLRGHP